MSRTPAILIVEPDLMLDDFLAEAMEDAGYRVVVAHQRATRYVALAATEPDLVLYAAEEPDGGEATFIDCVRILVGATVPIVRMSTVEPHTVVRGVTAYVVKPFILEALEACVAAHIQLHERTV